MIYHCKVMVIWFWNVFCYSDVWFQEKNKNKVDVLYYNAKYSLLSTCDKCTFNFFVLVFVFVCFPTGQNGFAGYQKKKKHLRVWNFGQNFKQKGHLNRLCRLRRARVITCHCSPQMKESYLSLTYHW